MATAELAWALTASALLLAAAWCDIATRTIPDGISIALAALGLLTRAVEGLVPAAASLLVAAGLFAAFVPLHARGAFGGGDIKLITALAAGLPPLTALDFLLTTVMAGGALGVAYLTLRRLPRPSPLPRGKRESGRTSPGSWPSAGAGRRRRSRARGRAPPTRSPTTVRREGRAADRRLRLSGGTRCPGP